MFRLMKVGLQALEKRFPNPFHSTDLLRIQFIRTNIIKMVGCDFP